MLISWAHVVVLGKMVLAHMHCIDIHRSAKSVSNFNKILCSIVIRNFVFILTYFLVLVVCAERSVRSCCGGAVLLNSHPAGKSDSDSAFVHPLSLLSSLFISRFVTWSLF